MRSFNKYQFVLWLAVSSFMAGCSGQGPSQPETAPVRGRVTYQGQPVAEAAVTFIRAGASRFSSGRTDAQGRFQLTTFQPEDGAVVGENVVTIFKRVSPAGANVVDPNSGDNEAMDTAFEQAANHAPRRSAIPEKYADRNTSDLKQNVASGENEFEIELVD